ncbi:MAG: hypothetical protein WC397_04085 [Candidatus Paceibacterota bacterium]|jgi:hypothetical protein
MISQQLIGYIKQQLEKGTSIDKTRRLLLDTGWTEEELDEAYMAAQNPDYIPPEKEKVRILGSMELLRQALKIYGNRFWPILGLFFLPIAVVLVCCLVLGVAYTVSPFPLEWKIIGAAAIILISIFAQSWAQIALICVIKGIQRKVEAEEALQIALPKIFSFWWVLLLSWLITIGGMLLFVIPGIIFSFWIMFAVYVLLNENINGINALLKSKTYMQGQMFNAGVKLFFACLVYLLALIPFFISVKAFSILSGEATVSGIAASIAIFILSQLFSLPLLTAYFFLFYKNLKEIKGNIGIDPAGNGWLIFAEIVGILAVPTAIFISAAIAVNTAANKPAEAPAVNNETVKNYTRMLKTTAMVYRNSNFSYAGLEKNIEYSNICAEIAVNGSLCQAQISDKKYCIRTKMAGEEYYCVDSGGYSGDTDKEHCTSDKPYCSE